MRERATLRRLLTDKVSVLLAVVSPPG